MKKQIFLTLLMALIMLPSFAQKKNKATDPKSEEGYKFTPVVALKDNTCEKPGQYRHMLVLCHYIIY